MIMMNILIITIIIIFGVSGIIGGLGSIICLIDANDEGCEWWSKIMIVCLALAMFGAIAFQLVK